MARSLLIHGGPIMTMNRAQPSAEAVGIVNGRILAVGTRHDVRAELGATFDEIDLGGRTAVPGFYDAHAHIMGVGQAASQIDLTPDKVASVAEIARKVGERATTTPPGHWILGRGYDQEMLARGTYPDASGSGCRFAGPSGRAAADVLPHRLGKQPRAGACRH